MAVCGSRLDAELESTVPNVARFRRSSGLVHGVKEEIKLLLVDLRIPLRPRMTGFSV